MNPNNLQKQITEVLKPYNSVKGKTLMTTERQLVQDVLLMLQGVESETFVLDAKLLNTQFTKRPLEKIKLSHLSDGLL